MRILLIKTSSMGDVIHNLPVVADIHRHVENASVDWVVEENFAEIPRLHSGVDSVIPVALRRWRKQFLSAASHEQWRAFKRDLRQHDYDAIIDTQGLLKSALIARNAKGIRSGYDRASAREPLASFSYQRKFAVVKEQHAVERNRQLVAKVLGYELDQAPSYGLHGLEAAPNMALQAPYVICLHATSRDDKLWREENWLALGKWLAEKGICCVFPSGSERERERATRLATGVPGAQALAPSGLREIAAHLSNAVAVIGVDTGLTHLACALSKPTIALYTVTNPGLTGVYGSVIAVNLGGIGASPSVDNVVATFLKLTAL